MSTISALIRFGSTYEDSRRDRQALFHFYDPANGGRGLTIAGLQPGEPSPDWALEDVRDFGATQPFSHRKAKQYLYDALTRFDETERNRNWGMLFQTMGHVIHHLQDMAQPQHTRNDMHCDIAICNTFFGKAVGLYDVAVMENYVRDNRNGDLPFTFIDLPPVFSAANPSTFDAPRKFWRNAGAGMAEFSNLNFISQGTNFRRDAQGALGTHPLYVSPIVTASRDELVSDLFTPAEFERVRPVCGDPNAPCSMRFHRTVGPNLGADRGSAESIFDYDLNLRGVMLSFEDGSTQTSYQTNQIFSTNRFTMDAALNELIPRAVAYSSGYLNYFFRGALKIDPPARVAYAVADHADTTVSSFTSIKAKITNETPAEPLNGGTIMAVAKFHLNSCYQADLSGEFSLDDNGGLVYPQGYPKACSFRLAPEFLLQSAGQPITLASGASQELTFTFPGGVPFNATDLVLQVVYRGPMGNETDAIAVGTQDIAEPTYMTMMNATDNFEIPASATEDKFYYYPDIINGIAQAPYSVIDTDGNKQFNPAIDVDVRGGPITFQLSLGGRRIATMQNVPEGRFGRIALLLNQGGFSLTVAASGNGFDQSDDFSGTARTAQLKDDGISFLVDPLSKLRKQTLQWRRVSYYHYYPSDRADVNAMLESRAVNALVPVPSQIE